MGLLLVVAGCGSGNRPPSARFTASPATGASPLSVYLDASASGDGDGTITRYQWDFGDGTGASGVRLVHTYEAAGSYTARLTVIDNQGEAAHTSRRIVVTRPKENRIVGTKGGQVALDFALADLYGQTRSLSAFRGHVVILSFWQTSCPACAAAMPKLVLLFRDYAERGVVLLGVNLDYDVQAAIGYLEENGYSDAVTLWGSYEAAMGIVALYEIPEVPYVILIDRQGITRYSAVADPLQFGPDEIKPWL